MRPPEEVPVKRTAESVDAPGAPARGVRLTARGLAKVAGVMLLVNTALQTPMSIRISTRKSKTHKLSVRESDLVSYVAKVDRKQVPPR